MVGKYHFTCRLLFLCFPYHSLDYVKVNKILWKIRFTEQIVLNSPSEKKRIIPKLMYYKVRLTDFIF